MSNTDLLDARIREAEIRCREQLARIARFRTAGLSTLPAEAALVHFEMGLTRLLLLRARREAWEAGR